MREASEKIQYSIWKLIRLGITMLRYCSMTFFILILSACASRPSSFQIDPEIILPVSFKKGLSLYIEIQEPSFQKLQNQNHKLTPDNQFQSAIKTSLGHAIASQGLIISSNPHFADIKMLLDFSKLQVNLDPGLLFDNISVDGKLTLKVSRVILNKTESITKSVSRSQSLKTFGRAESTEVTGLVNEVIGETVTQAFLDDKVKAFFSGN